MLEVSRIIGRDRELAQLGLAVGQGGDGLRLGLLTGPSGRGKTTLHGAAVAAAATRGFRSIAVDGRAGTLSTPFAPWLEALPALRPLVEQHGAGAAPDMDQIGIGLVALLAELTADQPLLLSFDDAQALDESSIALLGYAVGVSERMDVSVLVVEQTDAVGIPSSYRAVVDGLVARRIVSRVELGPMSDASVRELVAASLGVDEADVPAEIVVRAQGNPWFAKELAAAHERGETELPTTIAAAATARLHALPEGTAQDLVLATALCDDGAHVEWLEALTDEKPRQFVRTWDAVVKSGLVRVDGDVLSIAHPLSQQALIDEMGVAMRRALHLELADVAATSASDQVVAARAAGFHLARAGKVDDAVAAYRRAAELNAIAGRAHEAAADLERALDAETRLDQRALLLRACAAAATELGNDRAVDHWTELGRIAAAQHDDRTYAFALFQQYSSDASNIGLDRLRRAASLGADRVGWSARAAALLASLDGAYDTAIAHDRRAIELAQVDDDDDLELLATSKLGTNLSNAGHAAEAVPVLRDAVERGTRQRAHRSVLLSWATLCNCLVDELRSAEAVAEATSALKYVDDLALERFRPNVLAHLAVVLTDVGQLAEASTRAAEAWACMGLAQAHLAPAVALFHAIATTEVGDPSTGTTSLDAASDLIAAYESRSYDFEIEFVRAKHLAQTGQVGAAVALAGRLHVDEPESMIHLALWAARLGLRFERPDAIDLARSLRAGHVPTSPLAALRIQELDELVDPAVSPERLDEVAGAWERHGRALDAARAGLSAALLEFRAGRRETAVARFRSLQSGLAACGGSAEQDFVTSSLRQLGTRSRAKSRMTNTGGLTKRELQIARLVASGLRNAEVAARLFLSEKTIAAHLSNIYGKVDVNSRVQLASWLQVNDETADAVVVADAAVEVGA